MDYYIANGSMDYMSKEPFDPTFNSTGFDLEDMTDSRSFEFFKSFAQHRERSIFFPIERFFSFYALFLLVIGTVFNLTSFCIMIRKNMRKYACMRYLAVLSLVDLMVLYQWNLNTFFKYNLSTAPEYLDLEEISLYLCRYISYMAFSCLQFSSWILSLVSLDRVMTLYSHYWKIHMQKPQRINLILLVLFVFIFGLNSHILFKNGYVETVLVNGTVVDTAVVCYKARDDRFYIWPKYQKVHLITYNLIPFIIMLTCNLLICYNVTMARRHFKTTKSKTSQKKIRRMTFMLFLVTFSFMILTLPSVIVHAFLRYFLLQKSYRRLVGIIVSSLMHTSHACNFLLYVYSAPNFKAELEKITCFGSSAKKQNFTEDRGDHMRTYRHGSVTNAGKVNVGKVKDIKLKKNLLLVVNACPSTLLDNQLSPEVIQLNNNQENFVDHFPDMAFMDNSRCE